MNPLILALILGLGIAVLAKAGYSRWITGTMLMMLVTTLLVAGVSQWRDVQLAEARQTLAITTCQVVDEALARQVIAGHGTDAGWEVTRTFIMTRGRNPQTPEDLIQSLPNGTTITVGTPEAGTRINLQGETLTGASPLPKERSGPSLPQSFIQAIQAAASAS